MNKLNNFLLDEIVNLRLEIKSLNEENSKYAESWKETYEENQMLKIEIQSMLGKERAAALDLVEATFNPLYRDLTEGEIIEEGDEHDGGGDWKKAKETVGIEYKKFGIAYRRPL